jgi:hypothetical protein
MEPYRWYRCALAALLVFVFTACGGGSGGGNPVDVTAREYAFSGIPATMPPGEASFNLDNRGGEVHELHLFKLDEGVGTVAELLDLSQDEAAGRMESAGAAMADPGDSETLEADLSAGRYAAVCLIPVGTKPEGGHAGHDMEDMEDMVFDPHADTHFKRGMYAEFTVG